MKRKLVLLLLAIIFFQIPVSAFNKKMIPTTGGENDLPNIFIYSIPEDDNNTEKSKETKKQPEEIYINEETPKEELTEEEILLNMKQETPEDTAIGATVLKGYAQFVEDSNSIYLKDSEDNFVLNIKTPQKISTSQKLDFQKHQKQKHNQTSYLKEEYWIAPNNVQTSGKAGDFTIGAAYNNEVDRFAMLESEAKLFTRYEKNRFAINSSIKKSLNTTYAKDYNTISVTPEVKINKYFSLKNNLSADITRNRRSAEIVFSVNPLAKKDKDRMRLEAGAKQTYYCDTGANKSQLNFSAKFKL